MKMFALVRSHFGKNPEKMSDEQFARLAAEALWLESYRGEIMKGAIAEVMLKLFGDKRD